MNRMKRLLQFVLPLWPRVILSVLLGVLTIGAGIGLLSTSAFLISYAALGPALGSLQLAIMGVRFFGISRGVFRYWERLVTHDTTFRLLGRIRLWFYRAIVPLAPAGLVSYRTGDLLTRSIADIETLEYFYVRVLAPPLTALVVVLISSIWLGSVHPILGAILLVSLLMVGVVLTGLVLLLGRTPGRELIEKRATLRSALVDAVQGLPDLLAYDGWNAQLQQISTDEKELYLAQKRMALLDAGRSSLSSLFTSLGVLGVLVFSILLVSSGKLDGVYLAVIVLGSLAAFESVQGLPQTARFLGSSLAAAGRLFEIADTVPEVERLQNPLPLPPEKGISIDHLTFGYAGGSPVLRDVTLDLPPGKHIALVGPSGAGKSTLASLLLRFWNFEEGRIALGGVDVRQLDPDAVRSCFSGTEQRTYLFNETIRENLLLANPGAIEAEIQQSLEWAHLTGFLSSLPDRLATLVGDRGMQVSGGERQRLALARAYLRDAPVYIFDEPAAALDAVTEWLVMERCLEVLKGRSVIWITHHLVGMEQMDEVLVMDAGRIVQRGTHEQLVHAEGLYRELWDLQNRFLPRL